MNTVKRALMWFRDLNYATAVALTVLFTAATVAMGMSVTRALVWGVIFAVIFFGMAWNIKRQKVKV